MKEAIKVGKELGCPRSGRHPRKGRLGRGFTMDGAGMVWGGGRRHWLGQKSTGGLGQS